MGVEGLEWHKVFSLKFFFKKTSRIIPWLPKRVLHIVLAWYYVYIVVEVTINTAKDGSQQSEQPENVNFEPIITGLKSDIFNCDQV